MINHIENYGYTNTIINKNNKKSNVSLEWMGNYDGEIADLKLKLNDNGNKKLIDVKLDNEDIIHLLNIPSNQYSLDERIKNDFLYGNSTMLPMIEFPSIKKRKSKKRKSKKIKSRKLFNLL
jgi:hypothetical protein